MGSDSGRIVPIMSITFVPPLDWPHYGIGFLPAVKRGFQKYATFSGRASRSEYWWWTLANAVVFVALYALIIGFGLATAERPGDLGAGAIPFVVLLIVWWLAILVPSIAITVRRLHDAGYSGWLYLLALIPSIGGIILIVFCVLRTSPMAAKYGPPYPEAYGQAYPPQGQYPQAYGQPYPAQDQAQGYQPQGNQGQGYQPQPYGQQPGYAPVSQDYGQQHQPYPQPQGSGPGDAERQFARPQADQSAEQPADQSADQPAEQRPAAR